MIPSNEPIAYPARGVSAFAEMKIVRLDAKLDTGKMRVKAVIQNFNDAEQELDPERHIFTVHIDDLAAGRMEKIFTDLDEVVRLVYNVQFIQHQVNQAEVDGENTTQLETDLQEAVEALNADPK